MIYIIVSIILLAALAYTVVFSPMLLLHIINIFLGCSIFVLQKLAIVFLWPVFMATKVMNKIDGFIYKITKGYFGEEDWESTPEGKEIGLKITKDSFKLW